MQKIRPIDEARDSTHEVATRQTRLTKKTELLVQTWQVSGEVAKYQ